MNTEANSQVVRADSPNGGDTPQNADATPRNDAPQAPAGNSERRSSRPLPEDADDEPELGYRLNAAAWGQGYATEGSRALIRKAFEAFGARRVHATTMAVNVGSWRVMEKAGLRHVRSFHQPWPDKIEGEEHGDVEYALTRDEWEAEREPGD